ncbi:hypothetical protein RN001_005836 [Aquatica leii]|uniref:Nuclease HARBI1 n=1 Tax=Aquatica leii TaxID=1421715 RepID=A0AAN7Q1U6_9COLE|nr:hypothetical protein RN001_005836 [Aquatica leii]
MEIENEIFIDDDGEILDIINYGFPRKIYDRSNYFQDMDNLTFFQRFRLTKPTVLTVLDQIEHRLEFPTDLNNSITPINQLLSALRFYACGGHQNDIADIMGMHQSTLSRVVRRVSAAIDYHSI